MASSLVSVDQVIETLLEGVVPISANESVKLDEAIGRVLADDISSPLDVPPADNSAMDGYALDVDDLTIKEGGVYQVSDRIAAGQVGQPLQPGTFARIFTGAHIPPRANAVVMQENTEIMDDGVKLNVVPQKYANIRPRGQDLAEGDIVLSRGQRLRPQDVGLMASVGFGECPVFRRLKVAIMSTGDELVEPPGPVREGQIFNSNRYTLVAMLRQLGMEVVDLGIVADTPEATEAALLKGAEEADCIFSSGGVSVGEEDYVKSSVEKLGSIDIWRIAIKPGKPMAFGSVGETPFVGLPGNPVSTFVTFFVIARPWLLKFQGCNRVYNECFHAVSAFDFDGGKRREYLRVKVDYEQGLIHKYDNQGSGIMSSVCWADALAEVEVGQQIRAGDRVKIIPI
ncbi:MAG: gephyrin-like molybdotransferase Glp [Pseudomonadales bacterium]